MPPAVRYLTADDDDRPPGPAGGTHTLRTMNLHDHHERQARRHQNTVEVCGLTLEYCMCRVLPDSVLFLREVLREVARLWRQRLGEEAYRRLRDDPVGERFLGGQVRLQSVPPEREVVVFWIPVPPDFRRRVKPQLIDYLELPSRPSDLSPV